LESRQDLLGCIAGGWGTSLIVSAQTGVPINIVESADCCLCDMPTSAQHPDFLGGQITFYDPRSAAALIRASTATATGPEILISALAQVTAPHSAPDD